LYVQIKQFLRDQIEQGVFEPGQPIPPERELAEQYGVNRLTLRRAVDELVRDGLLVRRWGAGTYVSKPKESHALCSFYGFTDDMSREGHKVTSSLLEYDLVAAETRVANWLQVPEGHVLVRLKRLRYVDSEPIGVAVSYIPYDMCPIGKYECSERPLYTTMRSQFGLVLTRATQYISAVNATVEDCRLLKVPQGASLIFVEGVTFIDSGRPVEYFRNKYRGDQIRFYLSVRAEDPKSP